MASLLDMRRRIKSVKNTQQITKAMKMVAAAKLKRAQDRVTAARPFAQKMSEVLGGLSAKVADEFSHPLLDQRGDEKYLIVLVSADKGLAGALDIARNVIKTFTEDTSIDKVFLVYTEFKTVLSQKPMIEQILPIPRVD